MSGGRSASRRPRPAVQAADSSRSSPCAPPLVCGAILATLSRIVPLLLVSLLAVAVLAVPAAAAVGGAPAPVSTPKTGAVPWPAPKDPMRLTRLAGLVPEVNEHLAYHVHSHLDVFVNGKPVEVPAGIGIDIQDKAVKKAPLG